MHLGVAWLDFTDVCAVDFKASHSTLSLVENESTNET